MRVTEKGARAFCLWMLAAFVVYMCFIGVQMAHAVNALDQVPKLISRATPADSAFVRGDTLYMNQMSVSLAAVLKAVAVQTDTVRGASSIVGIVDDTLIVDTDSTGSDVTIRFGRWGGGLRWHRATDALQFSNDFSTWTAIGSGGSSSTNADSLGHKAVKIRPTTDGYVLKYDSDGDSLYLSADATGAAGDSNAIVYETDRVGMYSDTGLYLGDVGDSTMLWYDLTEDNIKAYVILYYVDDISDSALMSKYWIESTIGDSLTANGFLTGLNSSNGISGGASQNIVSIQLDPSYFIVRNDTMRISGGIVILEDSTAASMTMGLGSIYWSGINIYHQATTAIDMNVAGGSSEFQTAINQIYFGDTTKVRVPRALIPPYAILYDSADYNIRGIAAGAANTAFMGAGTSAPPTFRALTDADIPDNITITETGDISSVVAGSGLTGGATSGAATVDVVGGWSMRVFADSIAVRQITGDSITAGTVADARIATTLCRDTEASGLAHDTLWANTPGFATKANVHDSLFANTPGFLLKSTFKDSIVATGAKIPKAALADSAIKSDTAVTLQWAEGRTIAHDSLWGNSPLFFRTAGNGLTSSSATVNIVGSDEITVAADSIFVADSKIKSVHIEDASLVGADMATGTIDSIRLGTACVKAAEIDSTITIVAGNFRTRAASQGLIQSNNFKATDPDSSLKIGSGPAGLTIGSAITLGTDITDDTTVVEYYPEPNWAVLGDGIMPTYKDSMRIYGDVDSVGNIGNVLVFSDTLLNAGQHRRGFQITIAHPLRVDSLRYVYIEGIVKDSSGTNEMYLRGQLRTTTHTRSSVDSLTAGNVKDYDSLGGDYGDNAVLRKVYLTGGAVTAGGKWYLLLSARHDAGTAYNWAKVGRICAVYSRTKL